MQEASSTGQPTGPESNSNAAGGEKGLPESGSPLDAGAPATLPPPSVASHTPSARRATASPPPLVSSDAGAARGTGSGGTAGGYGPPRGGGGGYSGPARTSSGGKGWVWALLLFVIGIGVLAVCGVVYGIALLGETGGGLAVSGEGHRLALREVVLEPASTKHKIAVVDMQGVISGDPMDYLGHNLVDYIGDQLEQAASDDNVKAVLLKIDSPGGEVLASDEIYKLLAEFQEEHDKPVVATMGTVAASGGYYVAAPCRWIVANELTITGSIGVIMQSYNWRALMDKVGVRPQVFKSGVFKDMLSPDKAEADITVEERRMVQDLVNETFERFKAVIEEGRGLAHARNEENEGETSDQGRQLVPNWTEYADGRLLSGKEAWKLGFVDELGDFAAAVDRTRKLAGIEEAKLVQYLRPPSFGSLFRLLGTSEEARIRVDLGVHMPKLRSGLYFLAPHLVR